MNNLSGLLFAYLYIVSVIGLAEMLRRKWGVSNNVTRKVVHVGVGMLCWLVPFLFDSPWLFIVACFTFVIINFLDWRYGFMSAMASGDRANLGTVYFPAAAAAVAFVFWDRPPLLVAALMPLTWGDGMAPIIGRRFGNHTYTVAGYTRSLEGSVTFLVMGGLFTWLALWMISGSPDISAKAAVLPALFVALATTLTEAVTIWGLDNLTTAVAATILLGLWPF